MLFQMSRKNGCNNLYFHTHNLDARQKSFFHLTSVSRRGPVNTSTPIFPNINLKKTITNLSVVSNVAEIWLQQSLLPAYNLPKRQKLLCYQTTLSGRGPVNPSIPTFGNINLTETMTNLVAALKFSQKRTQRSLFVPQTL